MSASGDSAGGGGAPASSHAALADLLLRWLEAEGILQPAWQRAVAAAASGDDAVLTLEVCVLCVCVCAVVVVQRTTQQPHKDNT